MASKLRGQQHAAVPGKAGKLLVDAVLLSAEYRRKIDVFFKERPELRDYSDSLAGSQGVHNSEEIRRIVYHSYMDGHWDGRWQGRDEARRSLVQFYSRWSRELAEHLNKKIDRLYKAIETLHDANRGQITALLKILSTLRNVVNPIKREKKYRKSFDPATVLRLAKQFTRKKGEPNYTQMGQKLGVDPDTAKNWYYDARRESNSE